MGRLGDGGPEKQALDGRLLLRGEVSGIVREHGSILPWSYRS
jgi:hypothetical protein